MNTGTNLITFSIWPLYGFLRACKDISSRFNRAIIVAFYFIVGFTFTYTEGSDAGSNARYFESWTQQTFEDFRKEYALTLRGNGEKGIEQFQLLTSYLISRLTSDVSWLFGVWAAVFGIYSLALLNRLWSRYDHHGRVVLMLLIGFALFVPITQMFGRFWIAYWVYVYGFFLVIYARNKWGFLHALFSVFIHQGFVVAFVLLGLLAACRTLPYGIALIILVASLFVDSSVAIAHLQGSHELLSERLQEKVGVYTHEENIEELKTGQFVTTLPWYARIRIDFLYLSIVAALVWLRHNPWKVLSREHLELLVVLMLFWAFTNTVEGIPSFGGRYKIVFMGLALLYLIYVYLQTGTTSYLRELPLMSTLVATLLWVVVSLRVGSLFLTANILYMNIFTVWFFPRALTIHDVINYLFKA